MHTITLEKGLATFINGYFCISPREGIFQLRWPRVS
jgi:hypothetical protein